MNHTRTGGIVALAIAGSLALSACGSSSSGSASAPTSAAAAAPTSAAAAAAPTSGAAVAPSSPASAGATTGAASTGGAVAPAACASGGLSGAGSSFQDPMEQQWSKDYAGKCSGAKVNYQSVGSGTGIQQFGAGTIDFAGSDVVMKADEQAAADKRCGSPAWHLPISAGGIGIIWNLPNAPALQLSPDTLADIFQGKIKSWDDAEIKADNPSAKLTSIPISVVYRSDSSGTNSVFTSYLTAASKKWTLGSGKTVSWPTGTGAAQNAGVSAAVAQTPGAITYTELAYAKQNKLPTATIKNGSGYVALTSDSVTAAIGGATIKGAGNNLTADINFAPSDPAAYPISTLTYVIVCSKYSSAAKVPLLKGFLSYAAGDGQNAATGLGFAQLPAAIDTKVMKAIAAIS